MIFKRILATLEVTSHIIYAVLLRVSARAHGPVVCGDNDALTQMQAIL